MNPMEIIKLIKNPKEWVKQYAQNNPNPMLNNLIQMAESNNQQDVEQFARNMLREQGQDYDKIRNDFK